jgi:hypothetical protein
MLNMLAARVAPALLFSSSFSLYFVRDRLAVSIFLIELSCPIIAALTSRELRIFYGAQ